MLSHALYENAFSTPVPCISIHSQTCIKLPLPLFVEIGPVILKRKNELEARRGFKRRDFAKMRARQRRSVAESGGEWAKTPTCQLGPRGVAALRRRSDFAPSRASCECLFAMPQAMPRCQFWR